MPHAVRPQAGDPPPASVPHLRGEQSPGQASGQAEAAMVFQPKPQGLAVSPQSGSPAGPPLHVAPGPEAADSALRGGRLT